MKSKTLQLALAVISGLAAWGCGAGQTPAPGEAKTVATQFEREPEVRFSKFSVLAKGITQTASPYLLTVDATPLDEVCFQAVRQKRLWKTENPDIIGRLSDHGAEIEKAILAWFEEAILSEDVPGNLQLEASFEHAVVDHTPLQKLRLSPKQECIDETTGGFLPGTRTITTQFGAKKIDIQSSTPIGAKEVRSMRKAARKAGCHLKAEPFDYPKALGPDGKKIKDDEGRPLLTGPRGELLKRADIPRPRNRPSLEWSLSCKTPLYFAVGEILTGGWTKEVAREKCSVNLIFSDATPRVPECEEFKDAGFGIEEIPGEDAVTVKVTTDGFFASKDVPYGERRAIQVAGRVVVWVEPEPIVEGALLHVDSFVLEPDAASEKKLASWPKRRMRRARAK